MTTAAENRVIEERFTMHDLRSKRASKMTLSDAQALLRHTSSVTTEKSYRRLPAFIEKVEDA